MHYKVLMLIGNGKPSNSQLNQQNYEKSVKLLIPDLNCPSIYI